MNRAAFSLVELSIVLVILGLLVGGILAGQSLIRASELRSVSRDLEQYRTAMHAFRDKYFALPGDMTNATSFWGTDPDCYAGGQTIIGQTCNGNGDGFISYSNAGASLPYETYRFWQHLANAGMLEGRYTGEPGTNSNLDQWGGNTAPAAGNVEAGINQPASKITGVGTSAYRMTTSNPIRAGVGHNVFLMGRDTVTANEGEFLLTTEAWNIDTKMDDGMPGTGRFLNLLNWQCSTNDQITGRYNLSNTTMPRCYAILLF